MSTGPGRPRRLLWVVNHKTLLPAEVPIFRELGYEVFIPKIIPNDPDYRSAVVTYEYDASLTLSRHALDVLNAHEFYGQTYLGNTWSPTVCGILNAEFDVLITSFSAFVTPVRESVRKFQGTVMARVFGLEKTRSYAGILDWLGLGDVVDVAEARGRRFVWAQGYDNLADVEPPGLVRHAHTVTVPLPEHIYRYADTWRGGGGEAILLCPDIRMVGGYYKAIYDGIKRDFGDLPHRIFGRQVEDIPDPNLLRYLSLDRLMDVFATAPVFIYPSEEPRHIHYSPIEAMVVGTPVLYRRGALTDNITGGADLPGACATTEEMRDKALRLIAGDAALAEAIRATQQRVVDTFSMDLARRQWAAVLDGVS